MAYCKLKLPFTKAFCSWPLNPVDQGLTVTTFLVWKQAKTTADTKINKEKPPPTADQIITEWCVGLELYLFPWLENGEGLGAGTQLNSGGLDTVGGTFTGGDISEVGDITGEGDGEGVKEILEGDGDGEYDAGADPGEYEGLSDCENDEKGSKSGNNGKGKCEADCLSIPRLTSPCILGVLAAFVTLRSCLLYALSPCWPMCLAKKCH